MTDKTKNILVVVSTIVVVLALLGALTYSEKIVNKKTDVSPVVESTATNTGEKQKNPQYVYDTNTNTPFYLNEEKKYKYADLPKDLFNENFKWQAKEEINDMDFFVTIYENCVGGGYKDFDSQNIEYCSSYKEIDKEIKYYKIANFTYNNQPGQVIYVEGYFILGHPPVYYFVVFDNKITILDKEGYLRDRNGINSGDDSNLDKDIIFVDKNLELPKINYPDTIEIPGKQTLKFEGTYKDFEENYVTDKVYPAFDPNNYATVFQYEQDDDFTIYINGIHPAYYNIIHPKLFLLNNNQTLQRENYGYLTDRGCGVDGLDIVEYKESELKTVGKSDDGNILYQSINTDENSFEYSLYKNYTGYQEMMKAATTTYDNFLSKYPVIIMKDKFDRYIRYKKTELTIDMAECGKPVIYLYPTTQTKVNVQVKPNGGLTKVDPFYPINGWLVSAKPNGELTNISDQQNYPYLFWEGNAYDMNIPNEGFVLKKENVKANMQTLLARLGLNEKETADFLDFWQEKLEVKPYVFVTFVSQTDFDKVAPLNISPKPDKVIRVFMDYQPLDFSQKVTPLKIKTPTRTGFTVVEWGGRLHQ